MVRAPCCEKMGLKKGPWTAEEDQILINYIHLYGHGNWRALPKQAGLLRCGKSCRLRWINYLRPDIKRGNFSREEEDTIIKLHEMLGNRWSAIAAKLPGRTDNEIKNVWHTHLKKRLKQNHVTPEIRGRAVDISRFNQGLKTDSELVNSSNLAAGSDQTEEQRPISPQQYSSDISSVTTGDDTNNNLCMKVESSDDFTEIDENFWSEVLSADHSSMTSDYSAIGTELQIQYPFSPLRIDVEPVHATNSNMYDSMDFWHNLFTRAGELPIGFPNRVSPNRLNRIDLYKNVIVRRERPGNVTSRYACVVERYEAQDAACTKHLREQKLRKLEGKNGEENDEDGLRVAKRRLMREKMDFAKVEKRVRTAGGGSTGPVRDLRLEDTVKYLLNLDVHCAHAL
ncbi:unnamed protein product [Dovyalis caffra]|uniref:Uncharacterized protein n=1 Tax=Dovyalis caffra TaxID=77055 RepID=A0AAV1S6E8_9ROSI|nr:unnamed protein product [Dovyalis caffra]